MAKRRGISRADVIGIMVMVVIGLGIAVPWLTHKRAEVRRMMVLQRTTPPTPDRANEEADMIERLCDRVTVHAPPQPEPGVYLASIPVPDDPKVTRTMLETGLRMHIWIWSAQHNLEPVRKEEKLGPDMMRITDQTRFEVGPGAKTLIAIFQVHKPH